MRHDKRFGYTPPPYGDDPIERLPGSDELRALLAEQIDKRLERGERHVHSKRDGCAECAEAAADAVVRFFEAETRVVKSDALDDAEFQRARSAMKSVPYLFSGFDLRLEGGLGRHPDYPTVEDLLVDLETIAKAATRLKEQDRAREAELATYRKWHETVRHMAQDIVEQVAMIDADSGGQR